MGELYPTPLGCRCRRPRNRRGGTMVLVPGGKPLVVATFANGALVSVQRIHWTKRDRCMMPTEDLDLKDWIIRVPLPPPIRKPRQRDTEQRAR